MGVTRAACHPPHAPGAAQEKAKEEEAEVTPPGSPTKPAADKDASERVSEASEEIARLKARIQLINRI
jgi:hypothetical protein